MPCKCHCPLLKREASFGVRQTQFSQSPGRYLLGLLCTGTGDSGADETETVSVVREPVLGGGTVNKQQADNHGAGPGATLPARPASPSQ